MKKRKGYYDEHKGTGAGILAVSIVGFIFNWLLKDFSILIYFSAGLIAGLGFVIYGIRGSLKNEI